ncbi:unnamed protein product [Blepharisma stoltei]|uniref:Anaphase-promoting complex subunit 13 n=1 Tax=Blepharisma stoltei TaxID=1481888 RepID=A0AAU9JWU6_9CILI|nr:unnamed protein product [Blepharisma stoltei]
MHHGEFPAKSQSRIQTGSNRDAYYSFHSHFPSRVLRVVDEEWRADKLIMPEIPVQPQDLPPDENDLSFNRAEDEKTWKDLSVNEMINFAHLSIADHETSEQNDMNIHGFFLDNRFFNQNSSII